MANNTFLGLQPYTEEDAYRFKGRTEESQELFRLVVRNDFTVCYAESGEGKTSLLNAGVFPLLRQNMYFPIAITFTSDDYERTPDSFNTIIDRCIRDSIAEYNEKNQGINVEYQLCSTDFQDLNSQANLQQALSQFSWWKLRNYKPQAMGLTFTPVFIFDQFEEVFNLPGSIVWTKKFFDWLEEVSSDSCPDDIIKKVRSIIGDKAAFPAIKEEKDFKAVFSLRKEFIGELDYWGMQKCFIPSLKDNRYCLKALTYKGAKKVMTQQQRFEEAKVEQVLHYFVQQYSREPEKTIDEKLPVIPALLLSVVCDSWEKDIDFFSGKDENEIGQSLNKILERFYEEALSSITNELSQQEGNSQADSIRTDIETAIFALVDSNGKRVRRKSSELSHLDFDAEYKDILSSNRIIKISKIDGEDYVEIVHDAMCPIIAKRKELYLAAEAKKREEEKLREQAKKNRQRMMIASAIGLAIIGLLLFFLWQNNRFLKEQEARNLSEVEKDSISKLNNSLTEQIRINEIQRESLNKQLLINEKQKDSLNQQLFINEEQKAALNYSLMLQRTLAESLNKRNAELEKSMAQIKSQQKQLEKMDSVVYYAELYKKGKKLQKLGKTEEALECFKKSAEGNDADALDALAYHYFKKDNALAEQYARRGALMGSEGCQLWLGQILYELNQKEEALRWLIKSAEQGQGWSQFLVGEMYENGEGAPKDIDKAIFWYRKSAKNYMNYYHEEAEKALDRLGVMVYDDGNYMTLVNQVKISPNLTAEELYEDGHWWIYDERTPEKLAYLIASAEKGFPQAQNALGDIFCSSEAKSLGIYDEAKAKAWYSRALDGFMTQVKDGKTEAMEELGNMHREGNCVVEKNIELAEKYYRMGAEKDNESCQLWLGQLLREKGQNEEALKWLEKAGAHGQGWAAYLVGQMYENGEGSQRDINKAIEWYTKSANTRNAYAHNAREKLRRLGQPVPAESDDW